MDYKAVFRIKPIKIHELHGAIGHHTRELSQTDLHIDRSKKNYALIGPGKYSEIKALLESEAGRHKILDKRAGVVFVEGLMTANRLYFDEHFAGWQTNPNVLKPWVDANLRFLNSGKVGTVKSAVLHLDEEAPHIHFVGVPVTTVTRGNRFGSTEVERLSYNAMFRDSRKHLTECRRLGTTSKDTKLGRLQTDYANEFKELNLVRGVTSRAKNISPKEFRTLIGSRVYKKEPQIELIKPSLLNPFSFEKTNEENAAKFNKLKKMLKDEVNLDANRSKAESIKNQILNEKIKSQERTIMELTQTIENQNEILRENKSFISASRMLSKEVVIKAFGYTEAAYNGFNFSKKFNAIDFVKYTEKCDFNRALALIAEHFPVDSIADVAAQSQTVKELIKIETEKPNKNNENELIQLKKNISLVDFARARGFVPISPLSDSRSSVTMKNGEMKIVISKKDGIDVFFDVKSESSGTIIDFCKYTGIENLGEIRKILRSWDGNLIINKSNDLPKKPTVLIQKSKVVIDKTIDFYALSPCPDGGFLSDRGIWLRSDEMRIDHRGNTCFPHYNSEGIIVGWEMKNYGSADHGFSSFSAGGAKGFGLIEINSNSNRDGGIVIAESMVDALSYAQLYRDRVSVCMSTAGGASDEQLDVLAKEALSRSVPIFIATDNDNAGYKLAERIKLRIPDAIRAHAPDGHKDWNEFLMAENEKLSTAYQSPESRIRPSIW
jgi:hypothetical protein